MNEPKFYCPVCRQEVTRTPHHRIHGHYNTNHQECEASREPFYITIREAATA